MDEPNSKDFESAIAELEEIVKTIEDGQLSLEKALQHFERGVKLSRVCHTRLEQAERRVELLIENGQMRPAPVELAGSPAPAPLEPAAGNGGALSEDDIPF